MQFEYLTTSNGLSHNNVRCILQDRQGYIWIGTANGLNRYDGYTFKTFINVLGDSASIGDGNIVSLYQDKNDIIWVGTSAMLSGYDPRTEVFTNYEFPASETEIHDFAEDKNGRLWIASGLGLFTFDRKTKLFKPHQTTASGNDTIQDILADSSADILWLATNSGIKKFDVKTGKVQPFKPPFTVFKDISREITHNLVMDRSGNLWMGTTSEGLCEFNTKTGKYLPHPVNFSDSSFNRRDLVVQVMKNSDEKIWLCGDGLGIFDPGSNLISYVKTGLKDDQGSPVKIRTLCKDNTGIYWLGSDKGIAKYDPKLYSFKTVRAPYPKTLPGANTILEDNNHKFWVGTYSLGLGSMDPSTGDYRDENKNFEKTKGESLNVSVLGRDNSMWFGSTGCLFHIYKKSESGNDNLSCDKLVLPAKNAPVRSLAFDSNDILWIGTNGGGLFRFSPPNAFKPYDNVTGLSYPLSSLSILKIVAHGTDSLLIGTEGEGLILMNTKLEKFEKIQFDEDDVNTSIDYSIINDICEDHKKNIWIGTENGGLWKTNASLSKFKFYSGKEGLQGTEINTIVEDNEGQIWLSTNFGLEIVDPENDRFVHFSEKDGLSGNQADYLLKEASGDLLLVDDKGLHIFRSSSINLNKKEPPVYINHLQILDKQVPIYKDTVIRLRYYQNYVSFEYVALNYTQSFKNRYKYQLEGYDHKWINAGDRRLASYANLYANLTPKTYTFQVMASNNNGIWSKGPARVTLIISPPWWRTWWFYALSLFIISASIYFLFQYRLKERLKALELRNTISRDLHDEVGSTLSSIGFLSSMALNDADSSNPKVLSTLNSINDSSHRMLDAMNDIIWSIQPKNDTLENTVARMISFASELLEARKIHLNFSMAENLKHLHLGLAIRHDFFVIYKEAVNNLAKYSRASEANINLELLHSYIVLTIKDNGNGFNPENIKRGNGLKNMESRARKIGAIYHLHTIEGAGTTIIVKLKAT